MHPDISSQLFLSYTSLQCHCATGVQDLNFTLEKFKQEGWHIQTKIAKLCHSHVSTRILFKICR